MWNALYWIALTKNGLKMTYFTNVFKLSIFILVVIKKNPSETKIISSIPGDNGEGNSFIYICLSKISFFFLSAAFLYLCM